MEQYVIDEFLKFSEGNSFSDYQVFVNPSSYDVLLPVLKRVLYYVDKGFAPVKKDDSVNPLEVKFKKLGRS